MVLIAAAAGAAKWFGSRRDDAGDEVQGDDPIVRAMLQAVNRGDLDGLQDHVGEDCRVYLNAYELTRGDLVKGPDLLADAIGDLRAAFPDVHWELYDELTGNDEGKHKIAIRYVSTTTIDAKVEEFAVAGFGIVEDKKLVEWQQVADVDLYNRRRVQTGEQALGESSDSPS